jgi:LmbE family N-acetylglucosaminyl deacetylase
MREFTHDIPGTPAAAWDATVAGLPPLEPARGRVTVLAAHPDDETLAVGGLVATLAASPGSDLTVIVASDGGGSHPDSPTHTSAELAAVRRREVVRAVAELGRSVRLELLDLPDGRLSDQVDDIASALRAAPADVLLSTWLHDGHPDHEACARAARLVAAQTGARLLEYPIWAWLWADPAGNDIPEAALRRVDLDDGALAAKQRALGCYVSQTGPLSDQPGDEPVLTERFLGHFARAAEVLVEVAAAPAGDPSYFERLYRADADPWDLAGRWYERRKRSLLLAALPRERFRRAFEPGCGPGQLSGLLRQRVDELVATDAAPRPGTPRLRIPGEWPDGRFDLIVLSEVAYYVTDLAALAGRITDSLDPDGVVVLCHWRRPAPDHPQDAATVHAALPRLTGLHRLAGYADADFLLDVLAADPRSVAEREGIAR